jgi:hypothetical protein
MKYARLRSVIAGATLTFCICCAHGSLLHAETPDDANASKSWTSSTEQYSGSANPIRTKESRTQNGNRTVDTQVLERKGIEGDYEPYLVVERETIKVDSTTVKIVERSYAPGLYGQRQLVQVIEEESSNLPSGGMKTVRTKSNPDTNGLLQVVQKEVEEKKQSSSNVQEIRRSVFTPYVNGGLSESLRSEERQTTSGNKLEFKTTDRVPNGNGAWQTLEVRQGTLTQDGKQQSREEDVLRPEYNGKLTVVNRTIDKETIVGNGQKQSTSETYSLDVPGTPRDGSLHPIERVTTVNRTETNGRRTTQTEIQGPNAGSPYAGLKPGTQEVTISTRDDQGVVNETRTLRATDINGNSAVVWVDFSVSDRPNEVQGGTAPASEQVLK